MSVLLILFIGYNNFNYVIDFWYSFGSLAASTILIPFDKKKLEVWWPETTDVTLPRVRSEKKDTFK